ncbi:TetR family transcriptional regulator [Amnibacterium flavum]|uniref:HTH tetR-type domain-containing protein n=1 Tax=Amnibacterium flavum TaxID=2173173 RepID=A0A2V1HKW0_9MICO|nr:TetR family transcriptional regulator [Amnibacterium flavum]PVZ93253.1 hypothetical protein DDQ50_16250 [Amnibacterium flavum]
MAVDIRHRSRERLRGELAEAAADFCAGHGFESVTAEEIAAQLGISKATFFRYFSSKEDAIIVGALAARPSLPDALRGLSLEPGTSAWVATRRAMDSTVHWARSHSTQLRSRMALITTTHSLRARLASDRLMDRTELTAALAERMTEERDALAVASAAIAAIDLGWRQWAADVEADLGTELDVSFELFTRLGEITTRS